MVFWAKVERLRKRLRGNFIWELRGLGDAPKNLLVIFRTVNVKARPWLDIDALYDGGGSQGYWSLVGPN